MRLPILAFLMLTPVALVAADSGVFKWVDDEGNVHYGDRPTGTAATRLDIDNPPPVDGNNDARRKARDRLLRAFEDERREEQELALKEQAEKAERERRCEEAKKRFETYRTAGYLYEEDENGERRVLSNEEHDTARAEARDLVREHCGA